MAGVTQILDASRESEPGREVAHIDGTAAELGEHAIGLRHDAAAT